MERRTQTRPSGWWFPARTTGYFLVVAAISLGLLAMLGLQQIRDINADNTAIRVDRAGRAASALLEERIDDVDVQRSGSGSPMAIRLESSRLIPDPSWDELLDDIGGINQGAANVFRYSATTNAFDRVSTTFRTPEGERVGGSQVEPGLIGSDHPAFASIMEGRPYVGEVPVAGRLRMAYLTPIVEPAGATAGILAVDVGWVDDLERINSETSDQAVALTVGLLAVLAFVCVLVMFWSFRPLHRLTEAAHALGRSDGFDDESFELTSRRDEIGYLANGLAKVADLQRKLEFRAYNDSLTSVPNRAALVKELEDRFSSSRPGPESFAMLIVDLDGFKKVNDGLGHQAGDELLKTVAERLESVLADGEFLARLGGDEFAVLSAFSDDIRHEVDDLAERVSKQASGAFETRAGEARVSASVGVAVIPEHGRDTESAMSAADLALYDVKRSGAGAVRIYERSLSESFERQLHLVTELRLALANDHLSLAYQPIFDMAGHLTGVEGLARWNHPVEGPISPGEFIPIAESAGLIDELGSWALREACRQAERWAADGLSLPMISINVSTLQLRQPNFVASIAELLAAHPAARGRLCLELTESVLADQTGWYRQVLADLTALGISTSIDDFGTGYSSLSYLRNLPVDQVKIDRSFITAATKDPEHRQLLSGIVGLGKGLGLQVVLEGIETDEEFETVRHLDCDTLQGFLLGRPMAPEQVAEQFGLVQQRFVPAKAA